MALEMLEMREHEAREIYEKLVGQKLNKENAMLLAAAMTIMFGAEIGEILEMKGMVNYDGGRRDDFYRGRSSSGRFVSRPGRGRNAGSYDGMDRNYMDREREYYDGMGGRGNQSGGMRSGGYDGMMDDDYDRQRMDKERMDRRY